MNELERKLNEVKEKLKRPNIISVVAVALMVIGAVLLITGAVLAKQKNATGDPLFYTGLGMMISVVVLVVSHVIVYRKEINEYYRLKKEIKHSK